MKRLKVQLILGLLDDQLLVRAQGCLGDDLGIVTSALIRLVPTGKASPPTTFFGASSPSAP